MVIGPRFQVTGIEPPGVRSAPIAARRAFWGQVATLVIAAKDRELRSGLDKDGNPMKALAKYTREHRKSEMGPADPFAPPLQPAHGLSRTRSLFTAQPTSAANGVTCWWLFDPLTGESWGEILRIHAQGTRRLPRRDVIGLAPQSLEQVKLKAAEWWASYEGEPAAKRPLPYRSPGWGQVVRTPEGKFVFVKTGELQGTMRGQSITAQEALRRRELPTRERAKLTQVKIDDHVYTMQAALGVRPPGTPPRGFAAAVPKKPKTPKPRAGVPRVKATRAPKAPATFETTLKKALEAAYKENPIRSPSGLGYANDLLAQVKAVREATIAAIEQHAVPGPVGAFGGMANPENFRTVEFWGIKWNFTGAVEHGAPIFQTVDEFATEYARAKIPERLRTATKEVYFTGQKNKDDAYWQKIYKDFTEAAASAGDGNIYVYGNRGVSGYVFTHESGHNLAKALYGSTNPLEAPASDYAAIVVKNENPALFPSAEQAVSDYARNSPAEDFAESARVYVEETDRMKAFFPQRYAVIHKLMTDPNYGG